MNRTAVIIIGVLLVALLIWVFAQVRNSGTAQSGQVVTPSLLPSITPTGNPTPTIRVEPTVTGIPTKTVTPLPTITAY